MRKWLVTLCFLPALWALERLDDVQKLFPLMRV